MYAHPDLVGPNAQVLQGKSDFMFDRRGGELRLWVLEYHTYFAGKLTHWMFKRIQTTYPDSTVQFSTKELGHDPNQG
jgi:hypothetical protein